MIVFVLLGRVPAILLLTLAGMVYLSWVEVRREPVAANVKLWWCLLVALTHLPGYVALRVWVTSRRRRRRTETA